MNFYRCQNIGDRFMLSPDMFNSFKEVRDEDFEDEIQDDNDEDF